MDPVSAMKAIETFGPYALVVFLAIAYWHKDTQLSKEREEKDKQNKELTEHLLTTIESNTEANIKLESAISNLSNGLTGLHNIIMKVLKFGD